MRVTVLGACGAWPEAGQACSGFLVEYDGFRLLVDVGYATVPRLLGLCEAGDVDAVYVSHGHPDHCADLNPLLRARVLRDDPAGPVAVYAPEGALAAVLALDRPGMLASAYTLHEFAAGDRLDIGPFSASTYALPHFKPDAGVRLTAGGRTLAYTGDTGPSRSIVDLARGADVFLAEASYVDEVPADTREYLSSARQAGGYAAEAGVGRLVLTHLMHGVDPDAAREAAAARYAGDVSVAAPGLVVGL